MASTPLELPDNLPASHAVILRQAEIIERHETRIDRLSRDLTTLKRELYGYHGYLQSDAYICYELVSASLPNAITPVACWAHGRRKFEPLVQDGPHPQATWILEQIQKLYDIEDRARNWTNSERHALRQAESRPIVRAIETWLTERDQHEFPKSPLRAGLNYFRNRWESFQRFLEDGAIPIDNNRTEAVIKGPVMGKKNWLFFGNEPAGETAATFYALTMTCKRHCIDVQAYLLDDLGHSAVLLLEKGHGVLFSARQTAALPTIGR